MSIVLNADNWDHVPAQLSDANPFLTLRYAQARAMLGEQAVLLGKHPHSTIGFMRSGRLNRTLEIPSLPTAAAGPEFWQAVYAQCRQLGITRLAADSFASEPFTLPPLRGEYSRAERREFPLDLRSTDLHALLSNSHKKNIKKALNKGCTLISSTDTAALANHRALMTQSFSRRLQRGEAVPTEVITDEHSAFLATGAGQLYQIVHQDAVVASVLVLRAKDCAYTHSSGNHPEGMKIGASHVLRHLLSRQLQAEGCMRLILGGAPPGSGLAEFKAGFGAQPVALTAAACHLGSLWRRYISHAGQLLRARRQRASAATASADAS